MFLGPTKNNCLEKTLIKIMKDIYTLIIKWKNTNFKIKNLKMMQLTINKPKRLILTIILKKIKVSRSYKNNFLNKLLIKVKISILNKIFKRNFKSNQNCMKKV